MGTRFRGFMDPNTLAIDLGIGLLAGAVGGLVGIGGSIVMLPALAIFHGYESEAKDRHHVYMAASMLVNIAVSLSATRQHKKRGAARRDVILPLMISMSAGIVLGVLGSNQGSGSVAVWAFAAFIWAYCLYTFVTLVRGLPERPDDTPSPPVWILGTIGLFTGLLAGFLGVGGGILLVPLLQIAGLPLRHAIAGSAGVMWVSATIGAVTKLGFLPSLGFSMWDAIEIAAPMGAGALGGAWFGAWLGHTLKIPALKVVIIVVLSLAALRMVA
ncbi:MAG: sulfite exporter TauE/SafE family protein [Planctomycetota bacterium]